MPCVKLRDVCMNCWPCKALEDDSILRTIKKSFYFMRVGVCLHIYPCAATCIWKPEDTDALELEL